MNNITKNSAYKQTIEPTGGQKVPVVFHVNDDLMPAEKSVNELINAASDERTYHHIAALTDVHSKPGRMNPSGTAVAVDGYIFPQTVDTAPNCGMRMIKTPFGVDDLSENQIDELFRELVNVVPTKAYFGNYLPYKTILEISKRGSVALLEHFKKDTAEIQNTMLQGNMFGDEKITDEDLLKAIPKLFFRFGQLRLGILGAAGNHFLDLMRVDEILQREIADKIGIKQNQYVFLIHTGSGLFGQYCSYFYTPKKKEHYSQKLVGDLAKAHFSSANEPWYKQLQQDLHKYQQRPDFYGFQDGTELAKNFMIAHRSGANHGYANRAMIQLNIEAAIKKTLDKEIKMPIVYDMTHISITKENHFGKDVWIHRNNVTRSFGPQRMNGTPLYEEIGEPIFVPSSMSTPAYLGVAMDENESTFFSAPHGMGRTKDLKEQVPKDKDELLAKIQARGVKLYNAKSKGIINQDSARYKNIDEGIKSITENNIMKPVAKMMPVAVLMY